MPPTRPRVHLDSRPYYKAHHATSLRVIADEMIHTGKPQVIFARSLGIAVSTLEKYVSQAALFLMEQSPSVGECTRYTAWRRSTRVRQLRVKECILIEWKVLNGHRFEEIVKATPSVYPIPAAANMCKIDRRRKAGEQEVIAQESEVGSREWRDAFDEFVLGEGAARFAVSEIVLKDEDIAYIRGSVVGMGDVKVVMLDKHNIVIERI